MGGTRLACGSRARKLSVRNHCSERPCLNPDCVKHLLKGVIHTKNGGKHENTGCACCLLHLLELGVER
jgi:hypothetical protein